MAPLTELLSWQDRDLLTRTWRSKYIGYIWRGCRREGFGATCSASGAPASKPRYIWLSHHSSRKIAPVPLASPPLTTRLILATLLPQSRTSSQSPVTSAPSNQYFLRDENAGISTLKQLLGVEPVGMEAACYTRAESGVSEVWC